MYKSKLQQLCQHNLWPLPIYSSLKHGPDHSPTFKASVFVNGASFDSAPACKSSKEAQNDAAMRAFLRLGSDSPAPQSDLETVEDEPVEPEMMNEVVDHSSEVLANALVSNDVQHPYKLQLHTYTQRNHLSLPSYSTVSIGPPHVCHFMACVTIGEQEFKSPTSSKTVKEAENAAAKAALTSLSPDGFEQISSGYVKNLLQELAQKEGLSAPKYKTSGAGPLHMQMFYSTVEVEGEIFQGKPARSKKLSLINAAEVAYRALEERAEVPLVIISEVGHDYILIPSSASRRLNLTSSTKHRSSAEVKDPETKNRTQFTKLVKDQEDYTPFLLVSDSAKIRERLAKDQVGKSHANDQLISQESMAALTMQPSASKESAKGKNLLTEKKLGEALGISRSGAKVQLTSRDAIRPPIAQTDVSKKADESKASKQSGCPRSENFSTDPAMPPASLQGDLAALSIADPGPAHSTTCQSYLLCNRVRVYTSIPNIKFPKGISLLQVADDKWVPVSLEFPCEKEI